MVVGSVKEASPTHIPHALIKPTTCLAPYKNVHTQEDQRSKIKADEMEKRRDEMRKKKGSKLLKALSCSSKRGGVRSDSNKSIEEILKSGLGTIMEEDQDQQAPMNVNVKKRHRIISRKFLSFRDMYMHFMAGFSSSTTQNFIAGVAI